MIKKLTRKQLKAKRKWDREYQKWRRATIKNLKRDESRKYYKEHHDAAVAQQRLNYAVKHGLVKKGSCKICRAKTVHGHHEDYKQALKVMWLCPVHHRAWHNLTDSKRMIQLKKMRSTSN